MHLLCIGWCHSIISAHGAELLNSEKKYDEQKKKVFNSKSILSVEKIQDTLETDKNILAVLCWFHFMFVQSEKNDKHAQCKCAELNADFTYE